MPFLKMNIKNSILNVINCKISMLNLGNKKFDKYDIYN